MKVVNLQPLLKLHEELLERPFGLGGHKLLKQADKRQPHLVVLSPGGHH